jgi:hypothetical protein
MSKPPLCIDCQKKRAAPNICRKAAERQTYAPNLPPTGIQQ